MMAVPSALPVSLATWVIEGRLSREQADRVWARLRLKVVPETITETVAVLQAELQQAGVDMGKFPGAAVTGG